MNSDNPRRRAGAVSLFTFIAGVCALACLNRAVVLAQSDPAADHARDEAQSPEYRELIEQALNEFKHKNWYESRSLFRRAHELSPNARTQRGVGMVSYEMRDYVQATVSLSAALTDTRQPLNDAQRKECESLLSRARTFVGAYTLTVEPPNAEVTLDGAPLQRDNDGRVLVPFGEHNLRAVAEGYNDSSSKLSVQGGEQGELRIVLYKPQALAAAPASSVEKTVVSEAPLAAPPPPPARESDRFIGHGIRYSWITLGATAAFGAAAAAVWFTGQHKVDDLDHSCAQRASAGTPCVRGNVDVSSAHRHEHATTALLGLTGAALVATGVLLSLEWPTEKRRERSLALDLSPQRVSLRGSF